MEELENKSEANPKSSFDSRWMWIGLGLLALIIRMLLNFSPTFTERIYSRGLYQGIRWLFDHSVTLLPFPLLYLAVIFLIYALVRWIIKSSRKNKGKGFAYRAGQFFLSLGGIVSALIFFFLFLWGFNYARIPIEDQLGLRLKAMDSLEVKKELDWALETTWEIRKSLPGIDTNLVFEPDFQKKDHEQTLRNGLEQLLREIDFPSTGRVRGRLLAPKGSLLRFGVAGIYIPYLGEGHVDGGLHPLMHSYTLTHEMAHGYGFTNEGTCNFLAFRACILSEDPRVQYSGWLNHTTYLLTEYRRYISDYGAFRKTLPPGIVADLNGIYEAYQRYPDWIDGARINNQFLKAQGIQEGIRSYNRVVLLVKAWKDSFSD